VVTVGTYWVRTRPARDRYDWSLTDKVVSWADGAGLGVHLHPLLYPANQHNPQWVLDSPHSEARANFWTARSGPTILKGLESASLRAGLQS